MSTLRHLHFSAEQALPYGLGIPKLGTGLLGMPEDRDVAESTFTVLRTTGELMRQSLLSVLDSAFPRSWVVNKTRFRSKLNLVCSLSRRRPETASVQSGNGERARENTRLCLQKELSAGNCTYT